MSEQRWTAPESGWYRWSGGGEPEFLGPEQPGDGDGQAYEQGQILMNSGGGEALEPPRGPALVVRWDTEPNA